MRRSKWAFIDIIITYFTAIHTRFAAISIYFRSLLSGEQNVYKPVAVAVCIWLSDCSETDII